MNKLERIFQRLEKTNHYSGPPANCIGTALYLVGLTKKDSEIKELEEVYEKYLKNLKELNEPELGCLISWEKEKRKEITVFHLGVVSCLDPLCVINRQGKWYKKRNARIVENYFEDVDEIYSGYSDFFKYYMP